MSRHYRYCGLTLASDWPLPELPPAADAPPVDLEIRVGEVPARLPDEVRRTATFAHNAGEALWWLDGVARFQVAAGGRQMTVEPAPKADPDSLRLMLLYPVMGLASVLRGDWMLNAAAVEKDGEVFALIGPSASGKSTAAALLLQRGFRLVSDSLLRLTRGAEGRYVAHPQAPWLQLWPDSIQRLRLDKAECQEVRPGLTLRRISLPLVDQPLPLARVGLLREQRGNDLDGFVTSRHAGRIGVATLLQHTAGNTWLDDLASRRALFQWLVGLKSGAPLQRLDVPWGWGRLDALAAQLASWCAVDGSDGQQSSDDA